MESYRLDSFCVLDLLRINNSTTVDRIPVKVSGRYDLHGCLRLLTECTASYRTLCAFPVSMCPLLPPSDEWGSITVGHRGLLDGGSLWIVTFDDYFLVARAGGAPLLEISHHATSNVVISAERVADAASPVVHRVLVAASSELEPTGSFELSLEGVVTRTISVDASAYYLQNVRTAVALCLKT